MQKNATPPSTHETAERPAISDGSAPAYDLGVGSDSDVQLAGPTDEPQAARPHVVIVGGGFAGLYCARSLKQAPVRVTLVDSRNFHLFQPLLYQVATGGLSPGDIAAPLAPRRARHSVRRRWGRADPALHNRRGSAHGRPWLDNAGLGVRR